MKIVLDTNVFVSSFLGKGNPRKIVEQWKKGKITICVSPDIIDEYIEVLQRLEAVDEKDIHDLLSLFRKSPNVLFTSKKPKLNVVSDPDDNKFFECAVELQAKYIISGDKKVVQIGKYLDIKIMTPAEFVRNIM